MNRHTIALYFLLLTIVCLLVFNVYTQAYIAAALSQELEAAFKEQAEIRQKQDEIWQRQERILRIFEGAETFEVTAYTHVAIPGVADINGTGDGLTSIGLPVSERFVAVDPRVIPLRKWLIVEGVGLVYSADTGGAIKGNRIDIFKECRKEAFEWGRRKARVVVL